MTIDKTLVAIAAEASGIMSKMYEMTLEYIKTRKQFGVAGKNKVLEIFNWDKLAGEFINIVSKK